MRGQKQAKRFTRIKHVVLVSYFLFLVACGGGGVGADSQAADPTVAEKPIAYVKRPTPTMNGTPVSGDLRNPEAFHPGAHLIVKKTASLDAPEIDVTSAIIGNTGDVRDPAFSDDGTKLLFALHKQDDNVDPPETWDLYEYDLTMPIGIGNPRPLIPDTTVASYGDEIEPQFMPNGRILFSSTRAEKTRGIQLDEAQDTAGKSFSPTIEATNSNLHAFNLYSMNSSGQDIRQLTFNMSDDLYPTLIRFIPGLQGRILFTRWEHSPGRSRMSLYTANPDGTDVQYLYGAHSHSTGTNNSTIQFIQPRETSTGNVMVLAMPFTGTFDGGDPTQINVSQYADYVVPVDAFSGLTGPAQISTSNNMVVTGAGFSPAGRFGSVAPLVDGTNRALVSYSLCYANIPDTTNNTMQTLPCGDSRVDLSNAATTVAPPRYGVFIYNMSDNTVLPITAPMPGTYYTDVAVAQDKLAAPYIPYMVDESPTAEQTGILDIRSVYDLDGTFDQSLLQFSTTALNAFNQYVSANCGTDQSACDKLKLQYIANPVHATADSTMNPDLVRREPQFLRIVKGVYLPDDTAYDFKTSAYGVDSSQLMRQIIGYTPIDPDGSVRVKVPANVPLSISIVDRNGRRIGNRHGFWLTVRPGETLSCNGCHDPASTRPHGRLAGQFPSINPGAATDGGVFPGTNPANPFVVSAGDTMAYVRSNGPVASDGTVPIKPSVNIVFSDVWTDPNLTSRPLDAPYSYTYASLTTPAPVNTSCSPWKYNCRVTINYAAEIHPLWSLARTDANTATVTCINCHNSNGTTSGQLNLTDGNSLANPDWFNAYEQLLATHNKIDAAGNVILVDSGQVDANGNPILVPDTVPGPMTVNNAPSTTSSFFIKFDVAADGSCPGPTPHCTNGQSWLSTSELKLLSEWVDIGAQYFNNPFLAPMN